MESKLKLLISQLGENRVKTYVDISQYLHTGLGGVATAFYIATTKRELVNSIELCRELKLPFLLIGTGSKMAISKQGFDGLVIKNRSDSLKIFGIKGKVSRSGLGIQEAFIEADSGISLIKLADYASNQGLGGFEVLASSPGSIGGCLKLVPVISEKTHQVSILNNMGEVESKQISEVSKEDIILSVVFRLKAKSA